MNVIVIRSCLNSCPYCFESVERQHSQKNFLDVRDARTLAVWSALADVESIGLLGGEPFLHPNLREIVDAFKQECPKIPRTIFTGGLVNSDIFDRFTPADGSLLFNVNESRDYLTPQKADQVIDIIDKAIRRGFDVTLGFNVWRTDFDTGFMPRLAHELGRTTFRWAIANPMMGSKVHTVSPERFEELSLRCFDMLQEATKLGLQCTLDCNLPLCFFNDKQLAWLVWNQPQTVMSLGACDPAIDVTPELEAFRCFSTSSFFRVRVLDFSTESALRDYFRKQVDQVLLPGSGIFHKCASCDAFVLKRCQAGCLGWSKTVASSEAPSLVSQVFELLDAGKPAKALEMVETANRWFRTPLCLYLAAIAAQTLHDQSTAYRYAAQALSYATDDDLKQKVIDFLKILDPRRLAREDQ